MRTVALASGSNGNSIYVETGDVRLLFDAGISGTRLAARAESRGIDLDRVDALLLSHNHSDHVNGAGVAHRRFGPRIHASRGTWNAVRHRLGKVESPAVFRAGATLRFGGTTVQTIPTPHDGIDGVGFVVEERGTRLGVLTDLGHPFEELAAVLPTLDGAYLESNYDPALLETGPYPPLLKDRISGPGGHLCNEECAELAGAAAGRLRLLVLCHLSGENNTAEAALAASAPLSGRGMDVRIATRTGASDLFEL